jgi:DNA polymerase elongation subunit (family B)
MAIAYAKLYELILKKVKDEKEAEELYKIVEEFIKENEQRIENKFKNEKIIIKNELKDELKNELATKEDLIIIEERLRGEMKSMEERILRYIDEKFHYLDKKIDRVFYLLVLFMVIYVITNPQTIGLVKLLFGLK